MYSYTAYSSRSVQESVHLGSPAKKNLESYEFGTGKQSV